MTLIPNLIRNPTFERFTGAVPDDWTLVSTTNTTITQLQRNIGRDHPSRQVIATGRFGDKLVYKGDGALRATIAAGAAADDFEIRQLAGSAVGFPVDADQRYAVTVTARCSVLHNILTVGIVGLVGTTDTFIRQVVGGEPYNVHGSSFIWAESTSLDDAIDVQLENDWRTFGFEVEPPVNMASLSIRLSNGSAGEQVIDLGEVEIRSVDFGIVGVA